jgi:hypothetical protein
MLTAPFAQPPIAEKAATTAVYHQQSALRNFGQRHLAASGSPLRHAAGAAHQLAA